VADVTGSGRRRAEVTGELPRFVRDALGRLRPVHDALDPADQATVAALVDHGLDPEAARAAVVEGRVPLALAHREIGDNRHLTIEELAGEVGVAAELLREIRVASGLPLPASYGTDDLRWARHVARLLDTLSVEAVVRSARARGLALSTIARNDLGVVRDEVLLPLRRTGADDLELAVALATTVRELDGLARELLEISYGLHLEHQLGTELSAVLTRADAPEVDVAVGFVDLVGWTSLSSVVDPDGLDEVLDAFEARVVEVCAPGGDITVMKYLGDAVMLVAPDPIALVETMVTLTTEVPELEDVPLRGGVAAGPTRVREGDIYGAPVNLAARLTDLARPWSLLTDDALADRLPDHLEVKRLRPMRMRGIGVRRPLSVRALP
jgi:adenylate cyclase